MIYATLTAWGMHRMGDSETTKTKLTDWERFSTSLARQAEGLRQFTRYRLLDMTEMEYTNAILQLRQYYSKLELSVSDATVVANSKALFHLFRSSFRPSIGSTQSDSSATLLNSGSIRRGDFAPFNCPLCQMISSIYSA